MAAKELKVRLMNTRGSGACRGPGREDRYSSANLDELASKISAKDQSKFLKMLLDMGHYPRLST